MNYKPIIIVAGEPNSIFLEIFINLSKKIELSFNLDCIKKILTLQMNKLKFRKKLIF